MLDQQTFGPSGLDGIAGQAITMCDDLFVRCPGRSSRYLKDNDLGNSKQRDPITLDFVIFAGGLGRSDRLQRNVEEAVKVSVDGMVGEDGKIPKLPRFVKWSKKMGGDPQMFVCMGLVRYHIDEMQRGTSRGTFKYRTWLRTVLTHN